STCRRLGMRAAECRCRPLLSTVRQPPIGMPTSGYRSGPTACRRASDFRDGAAERGSCRGGGAMQKRALGVCAVLLLAGCGAGEQEQESLGRSQQAVAAPLAKAYCDIQVTGKGVKPMETDYLPHVITCENGGANLQALKAQ